MEEALTAEQVESLLQRGMIVCFSVRRRIPEASNSVVMLQIYADPFLLLLCSVLSSFKDARNCKEVKRVRDEWMLELI